MREYLEEMNKDNRDYHTLEAEYIFAFCCAMVCGKMGN